MKKYLKYIIFASIIIVLIAIDQVSKALIRSSVGYLEIKEVIPNFFYLTYSLNYGALNGSMQGARVFLILITIIALGFFGYLSRSIDFKNKKLYTSGLILVFAGTIGNFIDRIFAGGGVTDFLMFYPLTKGHDWFLGHLFSLDPFPTFNVADVCLTVGVVIFLVYLLFFDKEKVKKSEGEVVDGNN